MSFVIIRMLHATSAAVLVLQYSSSLLRCWHNSHKAKSRESAENIKLYLITNYERKHIQKDTEKNRIWCTCQSREREGNKLFLNALLVRISLT